MNARALALLVVWGGLIGGRHPAGRGPAPLTEPEVRSWLREYEPLLGRPLADVVALLGQPAGPAGGVPGKPIVFARTATRRSMNVGFRQGVVDSLQIQPDDGEELPAREVTDRPETYYRCYGRTEAISDYMIAWSRDGTMMFQFQYDGRGLRFYRVILLKSTGQAAARGVRPCRGTPKSPEIREAMSRPNDPAPGPSASPDDEPVRVEADGEGFLSATPKALTGFVSA